MTPEAPHAAPVEQRSDLPSMRRTSRAERIRPTYGFDDVSLAPGPETVEPADVDTSVEIGGLRLTIPILAAAMDAVVDARFCGELARLGGLAVLNLEGVQARYDEPAQVLERIVAAPDDAVQELLAEAYAAPVREELIARRIEEIRAAGSPVAVAATPAAARRFGPFCAEQGADLFLVQSQVSSARHLASGYDPLELSDFTRFMPIPVAVGNTTSFDAACLSSSSALFDTCRLGGFSALTLTFSFESAAIRAGTIGDLGPTSSNSGFITLSKYVQL